MIMSHRSLLLVLLDKNILVDCRFFRSFVLYSLRHGKKEKKNQKYFFCARARKIEQIQDLHFWGAKTKIMTPSEAKQIQNSILDLTSSQSTK